MNDIQLCLNQILQSQGNNTSTNGILHVYFHDIGLPLRKMRSGNHFGYLKPIVVPSFVVTVNTIQVIDVTLSEHLIEHKVLQVPYLLQIVEQEILKIEYNVGNLL